MTRTESLIERIAIALEKLADDPVVEIDAGPPICPHCGKLDPTVRFVSEESTGKLSEFIIQGTCQECSEILYGSIESYSMHQSVETLQQEFQMRRAGDNGTSG